ncbi:EamA/RhaT family transporter [Actinomadura sp. KC216]|uniref:EamA family transporter n=1 Tax=Actinomadura sp. KC216 TaxID=2530370 RepID=UPI001052730C|nr:DMT family transporter [Actinomadura sp. KC216]TDB85926.1 EamA/RhaT family transporter [Actinomadura sp. KC216]
MAVVLGVAAAVASSASGPFGKSLIEAGWSAGGVTVLRTALAALVLLPAAFMAATRRRFALRSNLGGIVVLGVVGIAGTVTCYFHALATLPVGVAMMVLYTSPVLVLGWAWFRDGERPAAGTLLGAATAIGGLVLVVAAMGVNRPDPVGILWAFGGAVCAAGFFLASDRTTGAIPPVMLACAGLCVATVTIGLLGLLGVMPVRIDDAPVDLGGRTVPVAVPLVLVVGVSTIFVYVAGLAAVDLLGARVTSFVALAEPVAALCLAWALLGETPRPVQLVGVSLVVAGVVLIRGDRSGGREATGPSIGRRPPGPGRP